MIAVEFEQQNCILGKPENMTDEQCLPLPVFKGKDTSGFNIIISCWKLSKEDIEEINKNGTIYLSIVGNNMPPVALITENPFK